MLVARLHCCIALLLLLFSHAALPCCSLEPGMDSPTAFSLDISLHRCKTERGLSSYGHEEWLNRLDRKRVVFIGDSITRYQYLELAFFLTYGRCPELDGSEYGYILSEALYNGWSEFFTNSSEVLNVDAAPRYTREHCLCARIQLLPKMVNERRHFIYEDVQGRRIELMFLQYFDERFDLLKSVTSVAETMEPTDVIVNFGAWLRNTNSTCGASEGDTLCPHIPWLCNYLKGEHSFRTWWLTATPRVDDNMVVDQIPPSHHLNIPARCQLRPSQVLDRKVVIDILQPDPLRQNELWWDVVHLHADANHGFNRQLVSRMTEAVAKSPREMHQRGLWKQLFANGR